MSRRDKLIARRESLEAALALVNAEIEAIDAPKTRSDVKRRIAIWQHALALLDEAAELPPGDPERAIAIKRAFKHANDKSAGPVMGIPLARWAKSFIEGESSVKSTRLKFAHLAQAAVREYKETTDRPQRGSPVRIHRKAPLLASALYP
jgi:hypothetical protein